jgi:hypothetical protein
MFFILSHSLLGWEVNRSRSDGKSHALGRGVGGDEVEEAERGFHFL